VHPGLSARSNLLALARTAGIGRRRVDEVIELAGLGEVAGTRAGGFSLGMGQRLGVAAALLGRPQAVVLDEPVNGLDPDGVRWIRLLLKSLAAEGRTVLVSSHLMSEMAQTATRLVVLGRGQLISQAGVEDFTGRAAGTGVLVRTPGNRAARPAAGRSRGHRDGRRNGPAACLRDHRRADRHGALAGPAAPLRAHPRPRFTGRGLHASHPGQHRVPRRSGPMSAVTETRPGPAPVTPVPVTPVPAGLSVFAAVFFVVPVVASTLPHTITGFAPYLPSSAGGALRGQPAATAHPLGP
jgi:energy-coupling factor transporter ATP-binding protein EcfA2